MKKIYLFLLLSLLMSIVGIQANAHDIEVANADGKTIYYNWINNQTGLEVSCRGSSFSSYPNEYTGNVVIPQTVTYNGTTYSVTSIGFAAFRECYGLTSVTIPNSVTSIGDYAFSECYYLTTVTIPNSVTSIGNYAFKSCNVLKSVTIPNNVTSIGDYAFSECYYLTTVTIPNNVTSIGERAFDRCSGLTSITVALGNTKYDSRDNCNAIIETASNTLTVGCKNSVIPNSVTSIGNWAFSDCYGLTSVTIPNNVTSIGEGAFFYCNHLTSMTIPNSVTSISNWAFSYCNGLTSVTIPNSVTSIGDYAFLGCSGLTSIDIPNNVTSIGEGAFAGCTGLTSVTIPNSVTSIGAEAFDSCTGLTSVTIPNSVTSIGQSAFYGCSGLTSVISEIETPFTINSGVFSSYTYTNATLTVPAGKKSAYESTNYWNSFANIEEAPIPNIVFADANVKALCVANWDTNGDGELNIEEAAAVTSIGTVFQNQSQITSFDEFRYFTGVTTIGEYALSGCTQLTTIELPSNLTTIDRYAFYNSAFENIEFPSSVTSIGNSAVRNCTSLLSIKTGRGSMTFGKNVFRSCTNLTSVTFDGTECRFSGEDAFKDCSSLTSVVITDISAWCKSTFSYASSNPISVAKCLLLQTSDENISIMKDLVIPNDITAINSYAFYMCESLESVTIPNSVTSIGNYVFSGCSDLASITVTSGNTKYDSRDNCNAIIETATNTLTVGCKNTVILNSVTSIGSYAFYNCSGLTSIDVPNSVTSIGNYAFSGCSGLTSVTVRRETPPNINSSTFTTSIYQNATLYVPGGCIGAYSAATYWKNFGDIQEFPESITMSSYGVSTFCSSYDLDFSNVSGLKAYIVSGFDPVNASLVLTPVTDVPAGTGLLLKGAAGEYDIPTSNSSMVYANLLTGVTENTTISPTSGTNTNFILANGAHGIGFYTISETGEIPVGKAYLHLPTSAVLAPFMSIFDDETTVIEGIRADNQADDSYYDLQGRRVERPGKGLYIVNGKKVIIK